MAIFFEHQDTTIQGFGSCALRALHGGRLPANYRGFLTFNFINERAWDPRLSPLFSRSQRSNSLLFRVVPPDVILLAT